MFLLQLNVIFSHKDISRFVLAATEHLHRRIAGLSGRIRQLEDALAALSPDPHPLLHADLLMQDDRDDDMGVGMGEDPQSAVQPDVIDAFGTLSISDHGISRFFGPTGGSEVRNSNDALSSIL